MQRSSTSGYVLQKDAGEKVTYYHFHFNDAIKGSNKKKGLPFSGSPFFFIESPCNRSEPKSIEILSRVIRVTPFNHNTTFLAGKN